MKKTTKFFIGLGAMALAIGIFVAADHLDAPDVGGSSADIADFYGFEPSEGSDNTVFIVDLQTSLADGFGQFDEDVLTEINIDTDDDLIEDVVIQAIPRDGRMYFFGPTTPAQAGLNSEVLVNSPLGDVEISTTTAIVANTDSGASLFAGPRQDPFFFDFNRFNEVVMPTMEDNSGFNNPGEDTFDGANTLSIVVEVPNSMLGATTAVNVLGIQVYKAWVTTNRKQ